MQPPHWDDPATGPAPPLDHAAAWHDAPAPHYACTLENGVCFVAPGDSVVGVLAPRGFVATAACDGRALGLPPCITPLALAEAAHALAAGARLFLCSRRLAWHGDEALRPELAELWALAAAHGRWTRRPGAGPSGAWQLELPSTALSRASTLSAALGASQPQPEPPNAPAALDVQLQDVLAAALAVDDDDATLGVPSTATPHSTDKVVGAEPPHRAVCTNLPPALFVAGADAKLVFLRTLLAAQKPRGGSSSSSAGQRDTTSASAGRLVLCACADGSFAQAVAALARTFEEALVRVEAPQRGAAQWRVLIGGVDAFLALLLPAPQRPEPRPQQPQQPEPRRGGRRRGGKHRNATMQERLLAPDAAFALAAPANSWHDAHAAMLARGTPTWALRQALDGAGFCVAAAAHAGVPFYRLERIVGCAPV